MELEYKATVYIFFEYDSDDDSDTMDVFVYLEELLVDALPIGATHEIVTIFDPEPDDAEGNVEAQQIAFQEFEPHD